MDAPTRTQDLCTVFFGCMENVDGANNPRTKTAWDDRDTGSHGLLVNHRKDEVLNHEILPGHPEIKSKTREEV
jgi:hypothetical protein